MLFKTEEYPECARLHQQRIEPDLQFERRTIQIIRIRECPQGQNPHRKQRPTEGHIRHQAVHINPHQYQLPQQIIDSKPVLNSKHILPQFWRFREGGISAEEQIRCVGVIVWLL